MILVDTYTHLSFAVVATVKSESQSKLDNNLVVLPHPTLSASAQGSPFEDDALLLVKHITVAASAFSAVIFIMKRQMKKCRVLT